MPVGKPAFLVRSWSFLPPMTCLFDFLVAKRRRLAAETNVVGGVKKLKMSFLTPPFVEFFLDKPEDILYNKEEKNDRNAGRTE